MPIYEYRCEGCGHRLEKLQSFSAEPLVRCPACDADLLKKLISHTSFQLKGGGWYATDYKKSGSAGTGKASESKSESSSDASAGGASKCETCPAAASAS